MWLADDWKDYEVIDCSQGEKLERWGRYLLVRPDPQVIWDTPKGHKGWKHMNGHYHRSSKGGGEWEFFDLPEQWSIGYKGLTFNLKPFSFKHTGLFPEQAANWDWFSGRIRKAGRPVKVLNLFAYTGGATLAAAKAGASVTHVDASKGMVGWAKENSASSGLSDAPIRWIVDDCVKFVEREIRRGNRYDAIIMDPPSYGRGPKGEIWKIEDAIHPLVKLCVQLLSDNPLFFLINSYTTGLAPAVLSYMLGVEVIPRFGGTVNAQEVGLPVTETGLVLPCGASVGGVGFLRPRVPAALFQSSTSRATSSLPHPCWLWGSPKSTALSRMRSFTSLLLISGFFSSRRAIAPDTRGVDILVPDFEKYRPGSLQQLTMPEPGATISGLHTHARVGPLPE